MINFIEKSQVLFGEFFAFFSSVFQFGQLFHIGTFLTIDIGFGPKIFQFFVKNFLHCWFYILPLQNTTDFTNAVRALHSDRQTRLGWLALYVIGVIDVEVA